LRKKFSAVPIILAVCLTASAQKKDAVFDGAKALEIIKMLSADAFEGRKSGLPPAERAAGLIAENLGSWGLEPAGENGTFFQEFDLENIFLVAPGASFGVRAGGRTQMFRGDGGIFDEWRVADLSGSGKAYEEIVLAGYGLRTPEYDDYAGADVKGKLVLINSGFPQKLKLAPGVDLSIEKRVRDARAVGAAAVLLAPDPAPIGRHMTYPAHFRVPKEDYDPAFVVLGINESILDFIVDGLPLDQRVYYAGLQAEGKPKPVATGIKATIDVKTELLPKARTRNVLARIRGTDKKVGDEVVILGAHMDHLGMSNASGPYNGANDNASGTAVVMEAARTMKANKVRPRRTIVFALWAAEESGLFGSEHYVAHPVFPLAKTVANINLDMVGQGGPTIGFGGIHYSAELYDLLKAKLPAEAWTGFTPRYGTGGSDHLSFLAEGVSAFHMVGLGDHLKGHHPGDDWELIKPELLDRSGRFLVAAALVLANEPGNIIVPHRAGLTKFRNEDTVDCLPVPMGAAFAELKDAVNPEVDYHLTFIEEKADAPLLEARVAVLKDLDALAGKLAAAPGLSIYGLQAANPAARPPFRGATLVPGLIGARMFRDDPDWLGIYGRHGLKYVLLGPGDLSVEAGTLSELSKRMLSAAQQAGILVVLDIGLEAEAAALPTLAKPAVLLAEDLLAGGLLEAMKKGGHVLGLKLLPGQAAEAYYGRLSAARKALTSERLLVWNTQKLGIPETKSVYVGLIELFLRDGWQKEAIRHSRQTPMSDVLGASFFNLLRLNQRPGR
jgi:hypothetical protein